MKKTQFRKLEVLSVRQLSDDSVGIKFDIPSDYASQYKFLPGQYVTLRAVIAGESLRRSYSICSYHNDSSIEVGIKHVEDGLFSIFAQTLQRGATLDVMNPQGRFTAEIGGTHNYLLLAAGSGITPCMSIIRSVLADEPNSKIALLYGNKRTSSTMFRAELGELKDKFTNRFQLWHVMSREMQDINFMNGHIDKELLTFFVEKKLIKLSEIDKVYLCGPHNMINSVSENLKSRGLSEHKLVTELFTITEDKSKIRKHQKKEKNTKPESCFVNDRGTTVEILLDGVIREFGLNGRQETVLEAAARQGIEIPFSCSGGMCCTCRCKVMDGNTTMDANYSLQSWEVDAGYTLACQSRSESDYLKLDFDAA